MVIAAVQQEEGARNAAEVEVGEPEDGGCKACADAVHVRNRRMA